MAIDPVTIGLITSGVGTLGKLIGIGKANKAAKQYDQFAKELPEAKESENIQELINTSRLALGASPLMKSLQRRTQTSAANNIFQLRQAGLGPAQLAAAVTATGADALDQASQDAMTSINLEESRRGAYLDALRAGAADEAATFDRKMARINSKASLAGAAAQTRAGGWNNFGNDLMTIGSGLMRAGGFSK